MMQKPFFYVAVMVALIVAAAWCANSVNPAPRIDQAQAIANAIAPTASATIAADASTQTPDVLATTAASSAATNSAAQQGMASTASANGTATAIAETQTPASWTATAVGMRREIDVAERDQALLGAQQLALTLTMAPTSAWMTDIARWPTARAQETQAAFAAEQADKQRGWDALMQTLWALALAAVPVALIIALIASAVVMPSALSWRLQGVSGGQAQATVSAAGRAPIPTTSGGQPAAPLDPHTRTERLALRVLGRMAALSGEDAVTLTSAPEFADNRSRGAVVAALTLAGLARSTDGVGVQLLDGWTVGELAEAIADGRIALADPPTPAVGG